MLFTLSWLIFCFLCCVLANTEIINFPASEAYEADIPFASEWPILGKDNNERKWAVLPAPFGTPLTQVCSQDESSRLPNSRPCPHELWMALDLTEGWEGYSKFTLRLSYPASFPADFDIQVFDPEELSAHFGAKHKTRLTTKTRKKYARIRAVDTGVLTPTLNSHTSGKNPVQAPLVPFILLLEPLYFGVLPSTVVPVLAYIVFVIIVACMSVPILNRYFRQIALKANEELSLDAKNE